MFVKICGITRPADAVAASDAGADAIGLNFVSESRRRVDLATARAIVDATPTGVMRIGVFRNHSIGEVLSIVDALGLDGVQRHGHHPSGTTTAVAAEVRLLILAMTVEEVSVRSLDAHSDCVVMLDGPVSGSGEPFDWSTVGDLTTRRRILLAGGLTPGNVADAVRQVRPWGVDVATGVETDPGHKDPEAVTRFIARARATADSVVFASPRPRAGSSSLENGEVEVFRHRQLASAQLDCSAT